MMTMNRNAGGEDAHAEQDAQGVHDRTSVAAAGWRASKAVMSTPVVAHSERSTSATAFGYAAAKRGRAWPSPLSMRWTGPSLIRWTALTTMRAISSMLVDEEHVLRRGAGARPRVRDQGQRLGRGAPVLGVGAAAPAAARAAASRWISGGHHHLALQAQGLEVATHGFERPAWRSRARPARPASARPSMDLASASSSAAILRTLVAALGDDPLGLGLGHLGAHLGRRHLLGRLVARVGLGDLRLLDHLGDLAAPDAGQVVCVVGHVLDLQHVEVQAQLGEVVLHLLRERLGELEPVLIDLLRGQGRQDPAQVALQGLLGDRWTSPRPRPRKRSTAFMTTSGARRAS